MSAVTATHLIANAGRIGAYWVCIINNDIYAKHDDRPAVTHTASNYGTSLSELSRRRGFRLGWAQMPGDEEILYFSDRDDHCFGYTWNVTDPQLSEWGYAPF
jgi:hypothetical protein